jgi:hypothetical protein
MNTNISNRTRHLLGRLEQVIACADRALCRDVSSEDICEGEQPVPAMRPIETPVIVELDQHSSRDEEGVKSRGNAITDRPGKGLFLRVV